MEHKGPGAIVRSWMPDRRIGTGRKNDDTTIHIYLDGHSEPVIEGNALDLFNGTSLIPYPLAHDSLASAVSFFPIPYSKGCKVTLDQQPFYYILTYREYPEGTPVRSFTMEDFRAAAATIRRVGQTLLNPESKVQGKTVSLSTELAPNEEKSVDLPRGAGAVRTLSVKLDSYDAPKLTRSLVLKMSFDGKQTVWCPVGDFFGTGVGLHPFQGWYRTVKQDGTMICRWVMPYRESGTISLLNLHDRTVGVELETVVGDWSWTDRSMYFYANWRHQYPVPTRPQSDWNYVTLQGRGVYVGDTLTVMNPLQTWWGEGDAKIWVDGESFPSIFGTGTEDYYGYSWGGRHADFYEHPFHAQVRAHRYDKLARQPTPLQRNTQGYNTETRTRALDTIPFRRSLQVEMGVWHWAECNMAYGVGVYWYGFADTSSNRKPDPKQAAARLPQPPTPPRVRHFENAVECETMKIIAKSEGVQAGPQSLNAHVGQRWSGASHLFVKANKIGDFVEVQFAAKDKEPANLTLHATKSYDYGILRFTINGQKAGDEIDLFAPTPGPSGLIELGVFKPVDSMFVLRAKVVGKNPKSKKTGSYFGLDCVVVGPARAKDQE